MEQEWKISIIGLDTSHSTAFPKLMQDPETPDHLRIRGVRVVSCLRFETPFQNKEGLDKRQEYLERIGVKVTEHFEEAVQDCDAIIIAINDPRVHAEYFEKCAPLGKPIFLDKPFADTLENMKRIVACAKKYQVRFFTCSSLRFDDDLQKGLAKGIKPERVSVWGPAGVPPVGNTVNWYGCHTFELLQRIIGRGAVSVRGFKDEEQFLFQISYEDGRRGVVELAAGTNYSAMIREKEGKGIYIQITGEIPFYYMQMQEFVRFLHGEQPLELEDSVEVFAMQCAAEQSLISGKPEPVFRF